MTLQPPPQKPFEATVPVIIAGGGSAGLTAALALGDAGVDAFIVEREHACLGSSSMSLGTLCAAGTREQDRHGVFDSPELFFQDIMAQTKGRADPVTAREISRESGPTLDWLAERHGVEFLLDLEWRPAFGHRVQRLHSVPEKTGMAMMGRLVSAVEGVGTGILTNARVTSLFAREDGYVEGVRVVRPDGSTEDIGCRALIFATSGFGANHDMIRRHISAMADAPYFGWEGNCGDAILWGQALGGAVADMGSYQGLGLFAESYGLDVNPKLLIEGGIQINSEGRRFSNELEDVSGQGSVVLAQPGGFSWLVYDEHIRQRCAGLPQLKELQELGGERRAEDADALATALGVAAGQMRLTLERWGTAVRGEAPDDFGRPAVGAPLTPPYYAIRVTGALFHTQGGLVIDSDARVLRPDGSPLPNLFAAGGAARGISGPSPSGYLPGAGLCSAITLGCIAGRTAASLLV